MARTKSSPRRSPKPPPPTWDEKLIKGLLPWRIELAGLALFLFSVWTVLALPGLTTAGWLEPWTSLLRAALGWGAYPLFFSLAAAGMHLGLRKAVRPYRVRAAQVIGFELIILTALPLSHQISGASLAEAHLGKGGGLVGWALSEPLLEFLGPILAAALYGTLLLVGASLIIGLGWDDVLAGLTSLSVRLNRWAQQSAPAESVRYRPQIPVNSSPVATSRPANAAPAAQHTLPAESQPRLRRRHSFLPPISLLEEDTLASLTDEEITAKKETIELTLGHFGLPAEVTQIQRGPTVTQFGVQPGYIERSGPDGEPKQQKVRVGQIASLQKDLALALAAPRLRIEAPVPGRGVVGIEVPNTESSVVRLRSIVESDVFYRLNTPLAVALGRDVSGAPVAADLAKLPHLLIAGTTGSGKSICINALITCLVLNNTPDHLQLVMVDPKKVELIRFNGLPHLIGNVEVEADRAVGVLRWLTAEMDRRYEMFEKVSARNLNGYNRKVGRRNKEMKPLPHIVVFIDELADLMHTYPGDVERTLCRLAQMARATGIHLVVSTQRPSTDVITGLIKANFPARLSFAVASGTDSRVILDTVGAEHLLGKGDLLFLPPDASAPIRSQGVFVGDSEIESIVSHWQRALPDFEPIPAPWESLIARHALLDETDSLLESAIDLAQKQDFLSTSYLQRRLRIGYPRAARIMEHLYEMGLVEDPKTGGKTRRTLVDEDNDPLEEILSERD